MLNHETAHTSPIEESRKISQVTLVTLVTLVTPRRQLLSEEGEGAITGTTLPQEPTTPYQQDPSEIKHQCCLYC